MLGGGSFGTVIANNVAQNGNLVPLWARDQRLVAKINATEKIQFIYLDTQ